MQAGDELEGCLRRCSRTKHNELRRSCGEWERDDDVGLVVGKQGYARCVEKYVPKGRGRVRRKVVKVSDREFEHWIACVSGLKVQI